MDYTVFNPFGIVRKRAFTNSAFISINVCLSIAYFETHFANIKTLQRFLFNELYTDCSKTYKSKRYNVFYLMNYIQIVAKYINQNATTFFI